MLLERLPAQLAAYAIVCHAASLLTRVAGARRVPVHRESLEQGAAYASAHEPSSSSPRACNALLLQVIDLLSQLPDNGSLACAVSLAQLLKVERDVLACAYVHLEPAQRQTPFWAHVSTKLVTR